MKFLIGASSAGHQVEGNNTNSDTWVQEYMETGGYAEKSLDAADHYHTYREDIAKMAEAGLNAYRFSLEWARIEPQEGMFDEKEMQHYLDVIHACKEYDMEPVITLLHFTCPKWLITKGGWEADTTPEDFGKYVQYVCEHLKEEELHYIVTINEANMGLLIAGYIEKIRKNAGGAGLQIGMDMEAMALQQQKAEKENLEVFGVKQAAVFTSPRSTHGDEIVCEAHMKAVKIIHEVLPGVKAGLSLSVRDLQAVSGGEENVEKDWQKDFLHYLPYMEQDDFFGVQTYTRALFDEKGEREPDSKAKLTQMGYENYPECVEHVLKKVHKSFKKELLVTENGIATDNDEERCQFIETAVKGALKCKKEGIPVVGYMYWSMIDNYEWQSGYSMHFGLMSLDRKTQKHTPKPSLYVLGKYAE